MNELNDFYPILHQYILDKDYEDRVSLDFLDKNIVISYIISNIINNDYRDWKFPYAKDLLHPELYRLYFFLYFRIYINKRNIDFEDHHYYEWIALQHFLNKKLKVYEYFTDEYLICLKNDINLNNPFYIADESIIANENTKHFKRFF
jgi:hypothetical protein